jgi:hypothetical protein
MKTLATLAIFLSATLPALAQTATPSPLVHHALATNAQAQSAFDRGLLDYYAYNPEAAEHEFYTAADLDRHLAMAYWGIAISNAPNLNVPANDDRDNQAREAIQAAKAAEQYASAEDRALIDAAAARFDGPKLAPGAAETAYRDALARIALAYPQDPDVAALYAEASLYVAVGDARGTFDTMSPAQRAAFRARVAALLPYFQTSLGTFPTHPGLLHFYIHAAQMAGTSAVAVDAAKQLASYTLPPEDSHLTHMPGHTFFDVGMYDAGLDAGTRSVAMDFADFDCCHPGYYSAPRYYHDHNVSFMLYAMTETGHTADAVAAARREQDDVFIARQLLADKQWQAVVAMPYAKGAAPTIPFARGIAYAKLGNVALAQQMLGEIPPAPLTEPVRAATLNAMRALLAGEIALAQHDDAKALALLTQASADAATAGRIGAAEFPALYYYSPHMALARLAMQMGKTDAARAALQAELEASPRSPAALAALAQLGSPAP